MAADAASRLALGTAQLGMPYGISNRSGQIADPRDFLAVAEELGIRFLDTAQHYGTAEALIGGYVRQHPGSRFEIVSKLDPATDVSRRGAAGAAVRESCERIGRPLFGFLLHREGLLDMWDKGLGHELAACRDAGLVRHLGVSVYGPAQFEKALRVPNITIIQAPLNVLDRRLADSGLIATAISRGIEIFFRSVFLQGLLTMAVEDLPYRLTFARETLSRFCDVCKRHAILPIAAAAAAVLRITPEGRFVIGCDSVEQLRANVSLFSGAALTDAAWAELSSLPPSPERVLNPSLWS